jgi:hypothetical protein
VADVLTALQTFSTALPLAILTLAHIEVDEAFPELLVCMGFLAALIAEFVTSSLAFAVLSCVPHSVLTTLPFCLSLFAKLGNARCSFWPLWLECQMQTLFVAQIPIWVESFGPAVTAIVISLVACR